MKKADETGLSDFLKLGETALSALAGAARDMQDNKGEKCDFIARKLNLVTREEFDAAFAMIKKARTIQDDLINRIEKMEKELGSGPKSSKSSKSTKPKTKKRTPARK